MSSGESLNQLALTLERKTLDLIEAGAWDALSAMMAPGCQFVTNQGILDKAQAMTLMQGLRLKDAEIRHLQATVCGDALTVSFELSCSEFMHGQWQSKDYRPRLSVWQKQGAEYLCVAYADFSQATAA